MKLARALTAVACAAMLLGTSLATAAETTTTFTVAPGFVGGSVNGFTFSSLFRNYGSDSRNAPFMEYYDQPHSMTYDAGVFNFAGFSLSGRPWDNYSGTSGGTLTADFRDLGGNLLETQTYLLAGGNSFATYGTSVAGVHEVDFGSYGFWPRVGSITLSDSVQSPVPEPAPLALLGAGLAFVGFLARRKLSGSGGTFSGLAA